MGAVGLHGGVAWRDGVFGLSFGTWAGSEQGHFRAGAGASAHADKLLAAHESLLVVDGLSLALQLERHLWKMQRVHRAERGTAGGRCRWRGCKRRRG